MSRYFDWNRYWSGIANYLKKENLIDNGNTSIGVDKYVRQFCRQEKYKGSKTDMYIFVGRKFPLFRKFIQASKAQPDGEVSQ
mgnify:CR=1 FL=1